MNNKIFQFFIEIINEFIGGLPNTTVTIFLVLIFTIWAFLCAKISSLLKTNMKLKTGYTRKTYHFLIFTSVVIIDSIFGYSGVCLFGLIVSGFVFYAIYDKNVSGLYLALSRESDSPNGTTYIILPYLSTLVGGVSLNYFFSDFVILGYLICGLGDASGEVIGTMFGKHRYKVKIFNFHNSFKSIEGSSSVFLISFIIYVIYTYNQLQYLSFIVLITIAFSSVIVMLVEIFTPKGFDNLSIPLIAVILFKTLLI